MELKPVSFDVIKPFLQDFYSKSIRREYPQIGSEIFGIYEDSQLVGYFITYAYKNRDLEINQGYLCKEFRHKRLSALAMTLLEQKAKKAGFKRVVLAASRTLKGYTHWMQGMGYKPMRIEFCKEI